MDRRLDLLDFIIRLLSSLVWLTMLRLIQSRPRRRRCKRSLMCIFLKIHDWQILEHLIVVYKLSLIGENLILKSVVQVNGCCLSNQRRLLNQVANFLVARDLFVLLEFQRGLVWVVLRGFDVGALALLFHEVLHLELFHQFFSVLLSFDLVVEVAVGIPTASFCLLKDDADSVPFHLLLVVEASQRL